ncbi:hypothetical protein PUN28_004605 [Cardiocondyla obscurior]|uniref:Secreted protein n=1 Tax=Cardiocondyla obscurior TaxID=286306 RepID=A0AAW2GC74_9HYME
MRVPTGYAPAITATQLFLSLLVRCLPPPDPGSSHPPFLFCPSRDSAKSHSSPSQNTVTRVTSRTGSLFA